MMLEYLSHVKIKLCHPTHELYALNTRIRITASDYAVRINKNKIYKSRGTGFIIKLLIDIDDIFVITLIDFSGRHTRTLCYFKLNKIYPQMTSETKDIVYQIIKITHYLLFPV